MYIAHFSYNAGLSITFFLKEITNSSEKHNSSPHSMNWEDKTLRYIY